MINRGQHCPNLLSETGLFFQGANVSHQSLNLVRRQRAILGHLVLAVGDDVCKLRIRHALNVGSRKVVGAHLLAMAEPVPSAPWHPAHFDLKSDDASCACADKERLSITAAAVVIVNSFRSILFIFRLP